MIQIHVLIKHLENGIANMKTLKQYILENEDHNHPKNWRVEKMHRDDTFNSKTRWDIKDKSGEIIDSHETSADAHHHLKNWRRRYTDRTKNTQN